jgi:hypothetical protein
VRFSCAALGSQCVIILRKQTRLMVKKEGSEEDKKDLLPKYYVKSGLFIFW